ncbi:DNA polymerase IV [Marinobacterium rhizophilum]|uniref:DNA polymerase IV n=2 Tax=Marinobacterium rhizophilum TaxID=420402 RepID=A0ABY5HNM7_9GAMM|nr:DNA polymerase IV [Marinobacterium rhizophilum]
MLRGIQVKISSQARVCIGRFQRPGHRYFSRDLNVDRKIIHCDCDCFYAAVEMRDNPTLRGIPLAVGGRADQRGVVATCNYEARAFGIHSAMSTARALALCPELKVVRGNMEKYREVSARIMAIYADYAQLIEPLSLDEAYLDVTGTQRCRGSATLVAEEIRQRVFDEVGIRVSAGVAPNKFLAKVASDWNKPDGLFVLRPEQVEAFVKALPVKRLHGVGAKTAQKLERMGVHSCADLRAQGEAVLVSRFGRFGQRLWELAWGQDERPVRISRERKSVSVEHTYAEDLPDLAACINALPVLLDSLAGRYARLSRPADIAGAVVKLKFHDFSQTTVEQATRASSSQAPDSGLYARLLQEAFGRGNRPVRLIGVGYRLSEQTDSSQPDQLALF